MPAGTYFYTIPLRDKLHIVRKKTTDPKISGPPLKIP